MLRENELKDMARFYRCVLTVMRALGGRWKILGGGSV
jgi:hypothetical protein